MKRFYVNGCPVSQEEFKMYLMNTLNLNSMKDSNFDHLSEFKRAVASLEYRGLVRIKNLFQGGYEEFRVRGM